MTASTWLLDDVLVVPMDGPADAPLGAVRRASLRVRGDRIDAIGDLAPGPGERVVAGAGRVALPGFVQGHVHATQTLFRGLADDLPLLDWLRHRIWPLEHAHDAASTRASARLTFAELLAGGTTTVQTMESVRHAEVVCEEALAAGLGAVIGNCLMDLPDGGVPPGLPTTAAAAIATTDALRRAFHGRGGRLAIAVAPRFVLSCSDELAHAAAGFARQHGLRIHTHAGEHPAEVAAVRARFGRDYVEVLHAQGLLGARTSLAHCVHTTPAERDLLVATGTAVLHCPSTNLKLGSGIAPIAAYDALGLRLALGADGAPCNNRLSMLTELRLAALLQNLAAGPGAQPAARMLWHATRGGARALGLDDEVGRLAPGLRADLVLLDLDDAFLPVGVDGAAALAGAIVYAAGERHLHAVVSGGEVAVRDGELLHCDRAALRAEAAAALPAVLRRAGLAR
ncbi:MAG: amidohydrolase family protein [Planctomycetes bacterium]|nr:amidohydrolase family protein [Planctomycetota bacterium]